MANPTFTDPGTLVLHSTSNATSYALASASPAAGKVYYVGVYVRDTTTSGVAPLSGSLTGTNGWNVTWTKVADVVSGTAAAGGRCIIFRGIPSSSTAGVLTYAGGETNEGCHIIPVRVDGADTTTPEVQVVREPAVDNTNNAATSGTITVPSPTTGNSILAFIGHLANETQTKDANYTELDQGAFNTPASSFMAESLANVSDATPSASWTTSSRWVGVAIEIRAAPTNVTVTPTALAMTWTGATPSIGLPVAAAPTVMALTWTGSTPTVSLNKLSAPTTLALTWTGSAPTVTATANVTAAPTLLAMTWTGATPTVTTPAISLPTALSLTWAGSTPAIVAPVVIQPTTLAMTWVGAVPTVAAPRVAISAGFDLTWTGATPAIATPVAIQPPALDLAWTGAMPTVTATANVAASPTTSAMTWTGATPTVSTPVVAQPTALALAWIGATPEIGLSQSAEPDALELVATFAAPALTVGDAKQAIPDPLSVSLIFATPAGGASKSAVPDALALTLVGFAPQVLAPRTVNVNPLAMAWSGLVPAVVVTTPGSWQPTPFALQLAWGTPAVSIQSTAVPPAPRLSAVMANARPLHSRLAVPMPFHLGMAFAVPDVVVFNPNEEVELLLVGIL